MANMQARSLKHERLLFAVSWLYSRSLRQWLLANISRFDGPSCVVCSVWGYKVSQHSIALRLQL